MDLLELPLNQLPYHLDILAFWAVALLVGLGGAFAIKQLSDAIGRTDRISRAGHPMATKAADEARLQGPAIRKAADVMPPERRAAASAPDRLAA